jgi:hypothetical protein
MYYVTLVSDRAGSFTTMLTRPAARFIDGGRILVTTLATFDVQGDAQAFLCGLRGVDVERRERTSQEIEALERHGLAPTPRPDSA